MSLIGDFNFLSEITNIGNLKNSVFVHIGNDELTIQICNASVSDTFFNYIRSDYRFTFLISDYTDNFFSWLLAYSILAKKVITFDKRNVFSD